MEYGPTLRKLRDRERMSREELAKFSEVSASSIQLQEAGANNPRPENVLRLARGLATKPDGTVDKAAECRNIDILWKAAKFPQRTAVVDSDLDKLRQDYPELDQGLSFFAHGNPGPEDVKFVANILLRTFGPR